MFPLFAGASVIAPVPLMDTLAGIIGPVIELVHANVVPAIEEVGKKFNTSVLHICCDKSTGLLVITVTGLTVTTTLIGIPGHPFAEGIIVYVTVPLVNPSVAIRTCEIRLPAPAVAPVTFVPDTIHVYVVPETRLGLVILMLVDCPEQIV